LPLFRGKTEAGPGDPKGKEGGLEAEGGDGAEDDQFQSIQSGDITLDVGGRGLCYMRIGTTLIRVRIGGGSAGSAQHPVLLKLTIDGAKLIKGGGVFMPRASPGGGGVTPTEAFLEAISRDFATSARCAPSRVKAKEISPGRCVYSWQIFLCPTNHDCIFALLCFALL
jgi:hypothetical protein